MTTNLQAVDYHAIAPLFILAGTALVVLLADLGGSRLRSTSITTLSFLGVLGALVTTLTLSGGHHAGTFCTPAGTRRGLALPQSCSYVVDRYAVLVQAVILVGVLVVVLLGAMSVRQSRIPVAEYHFLLLSATTGMVAIAASRDLLMLFVALEVLALPTFALAGLRRGDRRSIEAAMKYFLVSALSTAVSLYGISLIYGLTGSLQLDRVAAGLLRPDVPRPAAAAAVVLTVIGFVFKVSAVPFHTWAPDTYQGAPLPVAAFLATSSKAAGFAGLLPVLLIGFAPFADVWGPVIGVIAVLTMLVGNVVALRQRQVVRLLAWSSIAQAGYLLVPLAVASSSAGRASDSHGFLAQAQAATLTYLAIYVLMSVGTFAAVGVVAQVRPRNELADYRGLVRTSPVLATVLAFQLVNLAGAPPGLAGLWAKVVVFKAAIDGHAGWLAVIMAVATVIGLAYYLRFAALLFAGIGEDGQGADGQGTDGQGTDAARAPVALTQAIAVALPAVAVVIVGVAPGLLLHLTQLATFSAP